MSCSCPTEAQQILTAADICMCCCALVLCTGCYSCFCILKPKPRAKCFVKGRGGPKCSSQASHAACPSWLKHCCRLAQHLGFSDRWTTLASPPSMLRGLARSLWARWPTLMTSCCGTRLLCARLRWACCLSLACYQPVTCLLLLACQVSKQADQGAQHWIALQA